MHPNISERELSFIEDSLAGQKGQSIPTLATTPWAAFLTSMPLWAILVANIARSWTFYLLILLQVRYFEEVFEYDTSEVSAGETEQWYYGHCQSVEPQTLMIFDMSWQ